MGRSKAVRRDDVSTSSPNSYFALNLLDLQQKIKMMQRDN